MNEFKKFIMRGNVVDLAVGIIIGAAFSGLVTALVGSVLTPLIAAIGGQPDFSNLTVTLHNSAIHYGSFINALLSFLIMAVVVYWFVVKPMNALTARQHRGKETPPDERPCPECLSLIPLQAKRCPHCTAKIEPVA